MVHLGVGLDRVVTRRDLQAGIAYALRHTGHSIVRVREEIDWLASVAMEGQLSNPSELDTSTAMTETTLAHPGNTPDIPL